MESRDFPWYDSAWLSAYYRATDTIRNVCPDRLEEFEGAFDVLRTRPDFEVLLLDLVFDEATLADIRKVTTSLMPSQLELHEARRFKRFVVHDHPFFTDLQRQLVARVSQAVGEPVEASYNFLSLYGPQGVCPLHLDGPFSKWTLDLCVRQSDPWPIYFAPVAPWPKPGVYGAEWEAEIKGGLTEGFSARTLSPGQAVLFSGSSQWHYRDVIPASNAGSFCDLLFFHFLPKGARELVEPANWARLFGVAQLEYDRGPMFAGLRSGRDSRVRAASV